MISSQISPPIAAQELLRRRTARASLLAFCRYVKPGYMTPPHIERLSAMLEDVESGRRTRVMILMPPRHGKSELASAIFPAWYLNRNPDARIILASYEADFAATWGRRARGIVVSSPNLVGVSVSQDSSAANRWDIEGHSGGMVTAGVGGPITGRGAHLLIIDDPVKNAEDAFSDTQRDRTLDWYLSTAYTRLEPGGAVILIMTRWHQDDLAGRLLAAMSDGGEKWDVLNLPALDDAGKALWPERYPASALARIRDTIGATWFSALYQQRPFWDMSSMFKREWFKIVDDYPRDANMARHWDLAASAPKRGKDPDWTVGALLAFKDGIVWIVDVRRDQLTPKERDELVRQTAVLDGREVRVGIEQEGGSSGPSLVDYYRREVLVGFCVDSPHPQKDKVVRANPWASAAEAGNVRLVAGAWNKDFLDEVTLFPHGPHDDQVDAVSGAFATLTARYLRGATVANVRTEEQAEAGFAREIEDILAGADGAELAELRRMVEAAGR